MLIGITLFDMVLQIVWRLLHIRPGVSVIGPRVREIFEVSLQQRKQWPQVFKALIKNIPGKIAQQLRQQSMADAPFQSKTLVINRISTEEQKALSACLNKRERVAPQSLAEHQDCRSTLSGARQKALDVQAEVRDASGLRAMLLVRPYQD